MSQIMPERRNEIGDVLRYKSGRCGKSRFVGTRVNQGKVEKRTFVGEVRAVIEEWGEWTHACDREAPLQTPMPMVPAAYRVKEEELAVRKLTDEQKAEIIELIEAGDISQKDIAEEYGVSQGTISDIKRAHKEREERRAERERARENEARLREEERKREEAERDAKRPEPIPENFLPRKSEQPATQELFIIAPDGTNPTLFTDAVTAEHVAEMLRAYDPTLCVIKCKVWGE